jgi:hypothetical protein
MTFLDQIYLGNPANVLRQSTWQVNAQLTWISGDVTARFLAALSAIRFRASAGFSAASRFLLL